MPGVGKTAQALVTTRRLEDRTHATMMQLSVPMQGDCEEFHRGNAIHVSGLRSDVQPEAARVPACSRRRLRSTVYFPDPAAAEKGRQLDNADLP